MALVCLLSVQFGTPSYLPYANSLNSLTFFLNTESRRLSTTDGEINRTLINGDTIYIAYFLFMLWLAVISRTSLLVY